MDNFTINITKDKTEKNNYTPQDAGVRVDDNGAIVQTPKVMTIKIRKVDANRRDTDASDYTQGDATLQGAIYQVYKYNDNTNAYDTLVTEMAVNAKDSENYWYAKTGELLVGKYMVKEKVKYSVEEDGNTYKYSYATGYLVDENEYYFEQEPENQTERLKEFNDISREEVVRGSVDVINLNETTSATTEGLVLRLTLDSNSTIYYEVTLDNEGNAEFIEDGRNEYLPHTIPYGKYTVTEIKESKYKKYLDVKNNPVDINIQTQDQEEHIYYSEEPIQAFLKIQKIDKETNKDVKRSGARIKLWDISKNEFVTQEGVDEFVTDENGTITISREFDVGEYIVYEINAPEGYYLEEAYRLPENSEDYGDETKGGKHITITSADLELEESAADEEVKIYYNVEIEDEPLKVNLEITKLGEGLTSIMQATTELGEKYIPLYSNVGITGVRYDVFAKEDIKSLDESITYATAGERVDTITTGENGVATTIALYPGVYEIKEVSCPDGYLLDETPKTVDLRNSNELVRVNTTKETLTDARQKLSLTFNKEFVENDYKNGYEEDPLAVFKICAAEDIRGNNGTIMIPKNGVVDILVANGNDTLTTSTDLPQGKYYIEEVRTTYPYKLDKQKKEYTLTLDNSNREVLVTDVGTIINYPVLSSATVLKVSSVYENDISLVGEEMSAVDVDKEQLLTDITGKTDDQIREFVESNEITPLEGARYAVFSDKECTKQVEVKIDGEFIPLECVTNEDGIIEIANIPLANYYLKEISAPEGYELSSDVIEVTMIEDEKAYAVATDDLEIKELIVKTDNVTGDPVESAKFEIVDEDENIILTTTTDEKGIAYVPAGLFKNEKEYTYIETEAPDIYDIPEEGTKIIATYDEEGNWTTEIQNVVNTRGLVSLTIKKMDQENNPVENCKFELLNNETGERIEAITNSEGIAVFEDIYKGWYTYKEVYTPEGYILNDTEYDITLMENQEVEFINNKLIDVDTGDIAIVTIVSIAAISIVGIIFLSRKRKYNS